MDDVAKRHVSKDGEDLHQKVDWTGRVLQEHMAEIDYHMNLGKTVDMHANTKKIAKGHEGG